MQTAKALNELIIDNVLTSAGKNQFFSQATPDQLKATSNIIGETWGSWFTTSGKKVLKHAEYGPNTMLAAMNDVLDFSYRYSYQDWRK